MPRLRCAASCNAQWAATPPTITAGFVHGKTVGRQNCRRPKSRPPPRGDCRGEAAQRRTRKKTAGRRGGGKDARENPPSQETGEARKPHPRVIGMRPTFRAPAREGAEET